MDVFVYGTLADDATARAVLDEYDYRGPAELVGLRRIDGRYPTLAPGGMTEGRILSTPDRDALDAYEGVDRDLYCRVSLPLERPGAEATVDCYVGEPAALNAPVEWPGEDGFEARVRRYCREEGVLVRER